MATIFIKINMLPKNKGFRVKSLILLQKRWSISTPFYRIRKDIKMTGIRMFIGLLIILLSTSAYAECYVVFGRIQLEESTELCEGLDDDSNESYIGTCFKVNCIGNAVFNGDSALTFSTVTSAVGENASTPIFLEGEREGLQYFTSRSYLTGTIWTRGGILSGSINTVDTGTIDLRDGVAAEILIIQGGKEDFEDASGRILVYGPELAPGWATYRGKICIDD